MKLRKVWFAIKIKIVNILFNGSLIKHFLHYFSENNLKIDSWEVIAGIIIALLFQEKSK